MRRIDALKIGCDLIRDPRHDCWTVPHMRVVAFLAPGELAYIELLATAPGIGVERLLGPHVVAGAIDNSVLRHGEGARVATRWLVVVGICIGTRNDVGNLHVAAADLGSDAAPEVLRGHHADRAAS